MAGANDFVNALRDPHDPDHNLTIIYNIINPLDPEPLFTWDVCHYWLRGLDCSKHEVHFLCTEDLSDDWDALLQDSFGIDPRDHRMPHTTHKNARHDDDLSEENVQYIRNLYRADFLLWQRVCGGG